MAAYIIVQIDVDDPDTYELYRVQVPPIIEHYGGEYIVRGGDQEILEGDWPYPRCVVLKFPTKEQAKAFHASVEYEGPKALRRSASRGNMIVVDGV